MTRTLIYLNATLATLPTAEPGTPLARDIAAIRENLLRVKARFITMQGKEKV